MTPDQLERIIGLARFAPSGDNCQPFSFEWSQGSLSILHDSRTARSHMNPRNQASILALGCLIEILELAARAEGYRFELTPSIQEAASTLPECWATLRFSPAQSVLDPLHAAIMGRSTDRRLYNGGDPSHPVFAKILAESSPASATQVHLLSELPDSLVRYILDCDAFLWRDPRAVGSLLDWVHFDRKKAAKARSGMHWTNLGVGFADSLALRAIKQNANWARLFAPLGGQASTRRVLLQQLRSSAVLGCITIKGYGTSELTAAGRRYLRTWLALNLEGYAFQPLSLPLFFSAFLSEGIWEAPMSQDFRKLFLGGQEVFRQAFGIPQGEIPIWAFRTGLNPPLPPEMRTYRKEVPDLLTIRD